MCALLESLNYFVYVCNQGAYADTLAAFNFSALLVRAYEYVYGYKRYKNKAQCNVMGWHIGKPIYRIGR